MTESVTPSPIQEPVSVDDNSATLSVDDGASSLTVDNAALAVTGGGVEATALRVTVASDSTGVLSVDDNGASLTVDGTVTTSPSGDHTVVGKAADGAAVSGNPVLIAGQDGTNTQSIHTDTSGDLQIDVLTIAAGDTNIGNVDIVTVPAPLSTTGGGTEATAHRVTIASDSTGVLSVDDNGGSLTVDGTVTVAGGAAHASPVSGNPNLVAGRASTAVPTDVGADGDAASMWTNRSGAQVVVDPPHVGLNGDPWSLVHEAAQYTTTQTSAVLVAGGASEKLVVTAVQIQVGGTTAGTLQLYFGTGAFARGTNRAIFDGEFAPSATLKPGVIMNGPFISGTNGDDLLVTTSAAINPLTINVWYYVVT